VTRATAPAKINLALIVGGARPDGRHDVATVLQQIDLVDRVALRPAADLRIDGFSGDTIVRAALEALAGRAGVSARWAVRLTKRIPVAAGLGGGSSDAATTLRLANLTLEQPLAAVELERLAGELGADIPFFLRNGPQLGTGDGTTLVPLALPQDFWVVLVLPHDEVKVSTADVYRHFDERAGATGFAERRAALDRALVDVARARDLAALPLNDLATSPLAAELERQGAFRADVSGAGPTVYGLFLERRRAQAAARVLKAFGRTWVTAPCWYG
jgi:4-diphosphocytidyl-2-C-methyl-D-erythritol kinase